MSLTIADQNNRSLREVLGTVQIALSGGSVAHEAVCDTCITEKSIDDVITHYLHRGYPYDAIVGLLKKREGLQMCVRTLISRVEKERQWQANR